MNKTLFTGMFAHAGNILVIADLVLVVHAAFAFVPRCADHSKATLP